VTDREEAGLRGQVRICSAERDYVYPDHHWVMSTTDTFSPNGSLLERLHRNPDGSHWSTICRYDEREQLIEKEQATKEPKAHQLFSYRYDPVGRLERVILQSAQEGERVFESVQYGADGTKTKTSYPRSQISESRPDPASRISFCGFRGSNLAKSQTALRSPRLASG
jgi:hypothetical protein